MTVQFVEIDGQKIALLPAGEFEKLAEAAEYRADMSAAIDAQARRDAGEEYLPQDMADRLLDGENPLRVWREYRGLSLDQLGEKVGRQASFLSKLERGASEGGVRLWVALAAALDVAVDDLVAIA